MQSVRMRRCVVVRVAANWTAGAMAQGRTEYLTVADARVHWKTTKGSD